MAYIVLFTPRADRDLEKVAPADRARITRRAAALSDNPHPPDAKKLGGVDALFRIRVGDYRIVYQVRQRIVTVTVVRIGHRKDVYRNL